MPKTAIKPTFEPVKCGEYRIIRVDGTEEFHEEKPTIRALSRIIGCDTVDTVNLRRDSNIMVVDDTGMIDGKPVNPKATEIYHSVCRPGTIHAIHGDVVIVNDRDF